jgi:hypothetical protein
MGEEGGVGKALGGSFGPGGERTRGGGPAVGSGQARRGRLAQRCRLNRRQGRCAGRLTGGPEATVRGGGGFIPIQRKFKFNSICFKL